MTFNKAKVLEAQYTKASFPAPKEAIKHDDGKMRADLLPWDALEEVIKVMTHGASKYGDRNWELGMDYTRLVGSTYRHVFIEWLSHKRECDEETGLHPIAHGICGLLMLLAYELRGTGHDNR